MSEAILVAHDLHKAYGDVLAVDGISLQVARGEVFGLLGPNGAGKTTMISMLTGLFPPDRGKITIDRLDLAQEARAARTRVGLVPQDLALYPTLSARQNLNFFGRIYGLKGKALRERVDKVLEMVGLTERAEAPIETYSGGMKRRINIAAGLLHKPQILFLDEPTVGVDPQSRNAIFESVEALNREGMTVIYTTHYMEEAQRLCHRVAIVDLGRIVALDTPADLIRGLGGGLILLGIDDGRAESGSAESGGAEGEASQVADQVVAQVAALPAVKASSRTNGQLRIEARNTQEALMGVLDITNRLDQRITSLQMLEPNLETVFLQLTGKKLRE